MDNIAEELLSAPAETEVPTETVEPEAEPEAPEETGEKEPEPTPEKVEPPSTDSPASVPIAALHGERDKRQEAQKQLAELQKQLEEKKEPPPSVFEDEQGAFNALRQDLSQQMTNQLLNEGEAEAIRQHDSETVEKAVAWVTEAATTSPYLAQQLANTPLLQQHRKVVDLYQQEQARTELENPADVKAKLREEIKAELLAEAQAEQEKKAKQRSSIPTSLVGEPSAGGISSSNWSGPTELGAVIGPGG